MKKFSIILIFMVLICFISEPVLANGSNHHNDTIYNTYNEYNDYNEYTDYIENNEYNNYNDMTYNYDVDQTYNYDQSLNTSTTNIVNNYIDNTSLIDEIQHSNIHKEAGTLLNTRIATSVYGGVPFGLPEQETDIIYNDFAILHFNPAQVVAKLGPGEFSQFHINITADHPIKLYLSTNRPNIKIIHQEAIINTPNGRTYADVLVTLEKGTYWTDGQVYFKNESGDILGQVRIVFENKKAIDHVSRVIMDGNYTTIGHGVRQNRGTWGWSAMAGVKINRIDNTESYYGVLTYDW